ncbi:MAG: cyanophycin synthetase, partial [Halanaerobium sp.]|nr:cyanophycin synthetase [Halanaerobium sp.]
TNVIKPLVAVITSIGFDHTAILGDTLSAIAREKAGIIKEGIPVVTGVDQQEALNVIEEKARLVGAPLFRLGKEVKLQITANDLAGSRATVEMAGRKYAELQIRLLGQHQARNAALAVAAYLLSREELPRTDRKQGGELEIIREGLAATWWPGRMELVNERPKVILDGAHNQAGMLELARFLAWNKDEFLQLYLIFGVLGDKDVKGMLAAVCHQVDYLVLTKNEYFRARNPEDVARNVAGLFSKVVIIPSEKEAVARVMELAGPEDLVCITGSLYTVGEVRKIFM